MSGQITYQSSLYMPDRARPSFSLMKCMMLWVKYTAKMWLLWCPRASPSTWSMYAHMSLCILSSGKRSASARFNRSWSMLWKKCRTSPLMTAPSA